MKIIAIFSLFLVMTEVDAGHFTPTKYEITLTPDFSDFLLDASVKIHVNATDSVENFTLHLGDNLNVTKVSFSQAAHMSRGHPQSVGHTCTFTYDSEAQLLTAALLRGVTSESIAAEGFIEIKYKTTIGEKNESKGIHRINDALFETDLKDGNAKYLIPVLGEDVAVPVTLSIITPYRAGVETELPAGEHNSVTIGEASLFSNNYNSGDENVKLSDLHFKIHAPTPLILD